MTLRSGFLVITLLASLCLTATARAETPQQAAQRLRVDAQFDRARAAEFRKFANEDAGVAQARLAQAADLERNAEQYQARSQFHANLANQLHNQEQGQLAAADAALAGELRHLAQERRGIVTSLQAHVNQWRGWAQALDQRAARAEALAQQLLGAGRL